MAEDLNEASGTSYSQMLTSICSHRFNFRTENKNPWYLVASSELSIFHVQIGFILSKNLWRDPKDFSSVLPILVYFTNFLKLELFYGGRGMVERVWNISSKFCL